MKAKHTSLETLNSCPECNGETEVVKLGNEPPREICLCVDWDGNTLEI